MSDTAASGETPAETPAEIHDENFRRDAHPSGRLYRNGMWVAMAAAFAVHDRIGMGVSVVISIALLIGAIVLRDKTPIAKREGGFFWRVAEGERLKRGGEAEAGAARTVDILGRVSMGLALAGVVVSALVGPTGLGLSLAYLVMSAVKYRVLAEIGATAG